MANACNPVTPWTASKEVIYMTFAMADVKLPPGRDGQAYSVVAGKSEEELRALYTVYVNGGAQAVLEMLGSTT